MQTTSLKLTEIQRGIFLLPEEKLDEIKDFIEFILSKSQVEERRVVQLKGIWANKGFEKINIEPELKNIRKEISDSILGREV